MVEGNVFRCLVLFVQQSTNPKICSLLSYETKKSSKSSYLWSWNQIMFDISACKIRKNETIYQLLGFSCHFIYCCSTSMLASPVRPPEGLCSAPQAHFWINWNRRTKLVCGTDNVDPDALNRLLPLQRCPFWLWSSVEQFQMTKCGALFLSFLVLGNNNHWWTLMANFCSDRRSTLLELKLISQQALG